MVLVNDKDAAGQNNTGFFRNVRVFEDGGDLGPGPRSLGDGFEAGVVGVGERG